MKNASIFIWVKLNSLFFISFNVIEIFFSVSSTFYCEPTISVLWLDNLCLSGFSENVIWYDINIFKIDTFFESGFYGCFYVLNLSPLFILPNQYQINWMAVMLRADFSHFNLSNQFQNVEKRELIRKWRYGVPNISTLI